MTHTLSSSWPFSSWNSAVTASTWLILTFFVVTLCEHESKLRGRHTCMLMHHLVPAQLTNPVSGAIVYVSLKMLWVLDDAKDYRDIQMGDYGSITICQRVVDGCPQWLEKGLSSLFCWGFTPPGKVSRNTLGSYAVVEPCCQAEWRCSHSPLDLTTCASLSL